MSDLYNTIAGLCKSKNVKIGTMAVSLNISKSMFTDLKMGRKKTLAVSTLQKLADYFGVTLEYLLGWDRPIDELDKALLNTDKFKLWKPSDGYLDENTPTTEAAGVSEQVIKLIQSIAELPEQEQVDVQNYIAFLKSKRTE